MSPPSLGNGSKEKEGCLQFHFDSYNVQNGRGSRVNFLALLMFLICLFFVTCEKAKFCDLLDDFKSAQILNLVILVEGLNSRP